MHSTWKLVSLKIYRRTQRDDKIGFTVLAKLDVQCPDSGVIQSLASAIVERRFKFCCRRLLPLERGPTI